MAEQAVVTRAELRELVGSGQDGHRVTVQFNPETLKVSFANQVVPPAGESAATDQRGSAAIQYVGKGTTKLAVQLWFDVTSELAQADRGVTDVRVLTQKVAYFITPKADPNDETKFLPPGVQFIWGTFRFDGIMDSLEESLEFFSPEGTPLRASVSLTLSQQNIQFEFADREPGRGAGGGRPATPGPRPLTQVPAGASLQGLAGAAGKSRSWMEIGAANGIENPRLLAPGQLVDLNVQPGAAFGVRASSTRRIE